MTDSDSSPLPALALGTYLLSDDQACTQTEEAIKLGYRAIDTAQAYRNEAGVGRGIKASGVSREQLYITTKAWPGNPAWGMPVKTEQEIIDGGIASVAALGLNYVDLFLIHAPFAFLEGTEAGLAQWRGCLALKAQGLAKAVGVSNWNPTHLQAIIDAGLELPTTNQLELHPLCQQNDTIAWLNEHKVNASAYSSLAPLPTWRVLDDGKTTQESGKKLTTSQNDEIVQVLDTIVSAHNGEVSQAQVLYRWAVEKGYPILPKTSKVERLQTNLDVLKFSLTAEEVASLDALGGGSKNNPMAWPSGDPMR